MASRSFRDTLGNRKVDLKLLPFFAVFILFSLLTLNLSFFWDKDILFSKTAHWLLLNHYGMVLPNSIDTGYPALPAYLLAGAWQLTSVSLPVMHLMMLPFTLGIIWQSARLFRRFLPEEALVPALLIVLANPVFLAQTVTFSTDLLLLFFMLLGVNSVLKNQKTMLAFAVTGLLFSHMRGLTVAFAIGLFDIYANRRWKSFSTFAGTLVPYLPGILLFTSWMIFHQITKGWTGYHANSPWAGCFEIVNFRGFIRNCLIVAWRLADLGNIFLWIPVLFLVIPAFRKSRDKQDTLWKIFFLWLALLTVTIPFMLIYKILNGHRYLIPIYYILSLLAVYLLFTSDLPAKRKKLLTALMVAGLLSGNFWVYPDGVSQGWDSSLAHLPWHHLRHEMIDYMDRHNIPVQETGSRIPNTALFDNISLNGDPRSFHPADPGRDKYIFYSNICNDFTDEEIAELKTHWIIAKEYKCLQVRVTLYKSHP